MSELAALSQKLDRITAAIERLERQVSVPAQPVAMKRADAAKAMGISRRKLEQLIAAGKVRTSEDAHLVPVAEVKRYCTPKAPKQRKPAVGHRARMKHVDGQSDDAIAEMKRALRAR